MRTSVERSLSASTQIGFTRCVTDGHAGHLPRAHFGSVFSNYRNANHALRGFFVRRTPRARHGACDHLRPGRLRASHAVCLASRTLEPVFCARKEGTDIESVSTTERILAESLVMRGDFFDIRTVPFGFYATSRHCIPRLSPRNSNSAKRLTMALQRTAPRVTVAAILIRASLVRSWRCLPSVASFFAPPSQLPRRAPQSLSLSR